MESEKPKDPEEMLGRARVLMAVQMSGCGEELEPLTALFRQWRRDGLLTRDEANDLAETSPLSRMGDWWMDDGPWTSLRTGP